MQDIDPVFAMIGRLNLEAGGGMHQWITKNETFVEALCTGKCVKKSGISQLAVGEVLFTNGERVGADVVLCNTGFVRDWSYIRDIVPGVTFTETRELFKHMVHPASPFDHAVCAHSKS